MSHHVHINTLSRTPAGMTVISLAICGPRGGLCAVEDISIDEADKVAVQLQSAIAAARSAATMDPTDVFVQDVVGRLGDPGLSLDPSFRTWCAANHGLLGARQTAERWCLWRVA
jgi:hypothetical protein